MSAKVNGVAKDAIGLIQATPESILVGDLSGGFVRSKIHQGEPLFSDDGIILELDSPVVTASFDA